MIEGLTIIDNTAYDFDIAYQTYTLTVEGVQNVEHGGGIRSPGQRRRDRRPRREQPLIPAPVQYFTARHVSTPGRRKR